MSEFIGLTVCLIVAGIVLFGGAYLLLIQNNKDTRNLINKGHGVLWSWQYYPDEWKYAAENFFDIKPKNISETGKVSFTKDYIYISNGRDEIILLLFASSKGYNKFLTEVYPYNSSPINNIRFQVRTKRVTTDKYGNETNEYCSSETLVVPVPNTFREQSKETVSFYQDILDKNPGAVAAVMPYGLGLSGK